jgi:hypothetical protein
MSGSVVGKQGDSRPRIVVCEYLTRPSCDIYNGGIVNQIAQLCAEKQFDCFNIPPSYDDLVKFAKLCAEITLRRFQSARG